MIDAIATEADARITAIPETLRHRLLIELLLTIERFNRDNDLGLSLPDRMILVDEVLCDYAERTAAGLEAPIQ